MPVPPSGAPSPVPGTVTGWWDASSDMSIGLPGLSAPLAKSSACSMYLNTPP